MQTDNKFITEHKESRTVTSTKKKLDIRCKDEDCSFRFYWSLSKKSGTWVLKKLELNHADGCGDTQEKRERIISSSRLQNAVQLNNNVVRKGESAKTNTNALVDALNDAGVHVEYGQGRNMVKGLLGGDPDLRLFRQFQQLGSFKDVLQAFDPQGTFDLRFCEDGPYSRFFSLLVTPSFAKEFVSRCREVMSNDGAHLKTILGMIMMTNVVKDANNQPLLCSLGIVPEENGYAWRILYEHGCEDFPNIKLNVNDAHKGSVSAAERMGVDRASCVRHVIGNVKTANPGAFGFALESYVWMIAKSATKAEYDGVIGSMIADVELQKKSPSKKIFETAIEYIIGRAPEFCSYMLLQRGLVNYDEFLSNGAEQINHSAGKLRGAAVIELVIGLCYKNPAKMLENRRIVANKCKSGLTPNALEKLKNIYSQGKMLKCVLANVTQQFAEGTVYLSERHSHSCKLVLNGFQIICSCKKEKVSGTVCVISAALFWELEKACKRGVQHAELYSIWEKSWVNKIFHLATWKHQLAVQWHVPALDIDSLEVDEQVRPVRTLPKKRGRKPLFKRYEGPVNEPKAKRTCSMCGEAGHNRTTCKAPDFDYYFCMLTNTEFVAALPVLDILAAQEREMPTDVDGAAEPQDEEGEREDEEGEDRVDDRHEGEVEVVQYDAQTFKTMVYEDVQGEVEEEVPLQNLQNLNMQVAGSIEEEQIVVGNVIPELYPCDQCYNKNTHLLGKFQILTCSSCNCRLHVRCCISSVPNANQKKGIDEYKCGICRKLERAPRIRV